ncbi:hypothetical protein HY625_02810 [Candidatus Uhrbacteria bacterium]|nr:hypothetical protein [Candidatus Uhrbacteria bacterium]
MKNSTERDRFESGLLGMFGEKIVPVEQASKIIARFKDGSFAMSQMGMMLYTNGYNLRGRSTHFPNGMIYCDGETIFGVGYFAKEGEEVGHLMIVAPRGKNVVAVVQSFIARVRAKGLTTASVYVRHLSTSLREQFIVAGTESIVVDPWDPRAMEEDEWYANRVFCLDELIEVGEEEYVFVKNLPSPEDSNHKSKSRAGHNRFKNFLEPNNLRFYIEPYDHTPQQVVEGQDVVCSYFAARREDHEDEVVGSTAEDYFALVKQKPSGVNGQDYFCYHGGIETADGKRYPTFFFAGEKIANDRVGLYATITLRFAKKYKDTGWDMKGFTAISQYVWLEIFARLRRSGIKVVDAGGSETRGLDDQKRQLGGKPEKSHWVVSR